MPPKTEPLLSLSDVNEPLAARMRPRTLKQFVGQEHILGEGRLLRRAIQADMLTSTIFAGPPGTGKTTLARIVANSTKANFIALNAVLGGVADVRRAIEQARQYRSERNGRTILFVDEVHRWNKAQQDALLPWVENGVISLIGATTHNPFFEVIPALVSRSRIFQLRTLDEQDLLAIARAALKDQQRGYGRYHITIDDEALQHLVSVADGDARSLLNALQLAIETTPEHFPPPDTQPIHINLPIAEESIQKRALLYDKDGDWHYDTISAFIKSLRGSDPDAALYWMVRMIAAGEEPRYIFRRMLILASEDIGLADPMALVVTEAAAAAFERVGLPEGQFHLSQAALYLATAPKSNSTLGYFDALKVVEEERQHQPPAHLRDSNRDREQMGHGVGYVYPHAYRDHWVAQAYLPGALQGRIFYQPSDQGSEARLREVVEQRRALQLVAMLTEENEEIFSWSPSLRGQQKWLARISESHNHIVADIQRHLYANVSIARHHRLLVMGRGIAPLLWTAVRRAPEGGVWGLYREQRELEIDQHWANNMTSAERPQLQHWSEGRLPTGASATLRFETIVGRNTLTRLADKHALLADCSQRLAPQGTLSLAEIVPARCQRLSELASRYPPLASTVATLREAEELLYSDAANPLLNWDQEQIVTAARQASLDRVTAEVQLYRDIRQIDEETLRSWLLSSQQPYSQALAQICSPDQQEELFTLFRTHLGETTLDWQVAVLFIRARRS